MRKTWLIFSQAVTVALAIVFVIATLKPDWLQNRPGSPVPGLLPRVEAPAATTPTGATATTGYSAAARRATPAVVSITTRKAPARSPHEGDPWFDFFVGDRDRQAQ